MTLEERVTALEKLVAAHQQQINNLAAKVTVKQSALLAESQLQDAEAKITVLQGQVATLLARL